LKTYKTLVEKPMLEISFDEFAENPREYSDNIGYFITAGSRYSSPDNNKTLINIVKEASETASNLEEHIKEVRSLIKENLNEEVLYIKPITRFEHDGIEYLLGKHNGWDYSLCGFYIVTNKTLEKYGVKIDKVEGIIKTEIKNYNTWVNGEVYYFVLYDKDGNIEESVGEFYDINEIYRYLPDEWKSENLRDYLVY